MTHLLALNVFLLPKGLTIIFICTPQKNRLSHAMLASLMRICMSSPDDLPVDYERISRIIQSFKNKKDREIIL